VFVNKVFQGFDDKHCTQKLRVWGEGVKPTVKEGGIGFSLYLEKKRPKNLFSNSQVAPTDPQIIVERKKFFNSLIFV
jgi:hypothetical protein